MPTLKVVSGPAAGHQFEVTSEQVLGREGTDITIPDPEISRSHARLRPHTEGIEVHDLGSSNGTFINDVKVTTATVVRSGDRVRFGNSTAQLVELRGGTMISPPAGTGAAGAAAAPGAGGPPPVFTGPTAPHQPVHTGPMQPMHTGPMQQQPGPYGPPPRDNSKKTIVIIAAVVGVLVLLGAIALVVGLVGGGVDNDELIAEADGLCEQAAEDVVDLTGQQPGEFVRNFVDITEDLTDDIRELGTPADDADLLEDYLASLEDSSEIIREAIPAADALDQAAIDAKVTESATAAEESAQLGQEFGFETCKGFELTGG